MSQAFQVGTVNNARIAREIQAFFQNRWQNRMMMKLSTPTLECFHSRPNMGSIAEQGLAILDTGASRSVIGADVWPGVWKSLPAKVQSHVKEKPSRIGFRFGNNQVTYSFKQVHVPIFAGRRKIWIVIEIAPKATPFLISIQAMKALGAVIDLSSNQCHLRKNKSWTET